MSERHEYAREWLEAELADKERARDRFADELVRALALRGREADIRARLRIGAKLDSDVSFCRRALERASVVEAEDTRIDRKRTQEAQAAQQAHEAERRAAAEARRVEEARTRQLEANRRAMDVLEIVERVDGPPNELLLAKLREVAADADTHEIYRERVEDVLANYQPKKRKAS